MCSCTRIIFPPSTFIRFQKPKLDGIFFPFFLSSTKGVAFIGQEEETSFVIGRRRLHRQHIGHVEGTCRPRVEVKMRLLLALLLSCGLAGSQPMNKCRLQDLMIQATKGKTNGLSDTTFMAKSK